MSRHRRARQASSKINQALVEGVGGMQFTAQAPPGLGRLIRIPFYMETTQDNKFDSLTGQPVGDIAGTASKISPVIRALPPAGIGSGGTVQLRTPQISWAILRIVGFECNVGEPIVYSTPAMELGFQDLKIGGGATLFVHEDFAPARIYLVGQDSFAGLRDYPILKSPNVAEVQVQTVSADIAADPLNFSCNLVCEILQDDNYGSHIPGPYARPGALVRQGGSFVT